LTLKTTAPKQAQPRQPHNAAKNSTNKPQPQGQAASNSVAQQKYTNFMPADTPSNGSKDAFLNRDMAVRQITN